jgi:hypothetical protein
MDKKERAAIESNSQIKEEKKLNYRKFWGWGIGLIIALMIIAYIAGFLTFGSKIPVVKDSEKKAYFEKDSATSAAVATDAKMDTVKAKE